MSPTALTLTTADIEEMFFDWLLSRPVALNLSHFQQAIAESESQMPASVCEATGYPHGTTVGHAVRCAIGFCDQTGAEYRLDTTRLAFPSEAASLAWWRANKDNPDRIALRHARGGLWEMRVAPADGVTIVDWRAGF